MKSAERCRRVNITAVGLPEKGKSAVGFYASRNLRSLRNSARRVHLFLPQLLSL